MTDPFLNSFLNVTATSGGGLLTDNGLMLPTLAPSTAADASTAIASVPARGGCPSSWPDWACTGVNAIGGILVPDSAAAAVSGALTGKPRGSTTDIAPHARNVIASALPNVNAYIVTAGAVLLGVLIIVLGAWSIVKD